MSDSSPIGRHPDPDEPVRVPSSPEGRAHELQSHEWDSDKALAALTEESNALDESEQQTAKRLFRHGLPGAALAITHMAQHCDNERIRLDAAKYVVERNLGQLKDVDIHDGDDPLTSFIKGIVREVSDDSLADSSDEESDETEAPQAPSVQAPSQEDN